MAETPMSGRRSRGSSSPLDSYRREPSSFKDRVHLLFDVPQSSWAATAVSSFVMMCIFASTTAFVLESLPSLEGYTTLWWSLETFFVTVFSIEYVCRFYSTPKPKCTFVKEPFNIIDLLAILPYYVELLLSSLMHGERMMDLRFLRVVRLVRVFRLFKAGKYSQNMHLITQSLARSSEALLLLGFFLGVALIMFGSCMFFVEQGVWDPKKQCYVRPGEELCSPFESIPMTFYWGVTTMTTVGYGDALPSTDMGKLVCGVSMVCGILVIALPVTMIGNQFADAYGDLTNEILAKSVKDQKKSQAEVLELLEDVQNEFDVVRSRCDDLFPRLKHLLAASLVAGDKCMGADAALKALEPSYDILHRNVVMCITDMTDYLGTLNVAHPHSGSAV